MTIEVHFYSIAKERAGQATYALAIAEHPPSCAMTLGSVLDQLFCEVPALAPLREACLYAIGNATRVPQYATMETPLTAGDIISIIPPMQGG